MSHFRRTTSSLGSLPPELLEEIIIYSALLADHPRVPSTFARTCRRFRALVYHQRRHKHLWRELFLILFDDPHPAIGVRAHGSRGGGGGAPQHANGKGKSKNCLPLVGHEFHWEDEYKLRIWTESFILRRTRPPASSSSSTLPSPDAEVHTALDTLLRVVLTAAPLPYDNMSSHYYPPIMPHQPPIISPLILSAHTQPSLVPGSRNTIWLARVLAHGLPRVLMARLTSFDESGNVDVQKKPVEWDGLLMKLVAQVGLMTPISELRDNTEAGDHGHVTADCRNLEQEQGEDHEVKSSAATASHDVRRHARLRVYNIAYVHPSRDFGPFLPLETHYASPLTGSGAVVGEEEVTVANIRKLGSLSYAVPSVPPIPDANLDLNSVEIPDDAGGGDNDIDETGQGQEQESGGDRDGEVVPAGGGSNGTAPIMVSINRNNAIVNALATRGTCAPSVKGDDQQQLPRFDWAWIAAARQVIEFNLRNLLKKDRHQAVLRAFLSLEGFRSCSAPGFSPAAAAAKGESERTFEDGEGWDWAGVEGQWRRCMCWLDYRDLIGNNAQPLAERFADPGLNEVMRIFPVTLRVARYSRARAHASWPGRPRIHFVGEMHLGSSVVAQPDPGVRLVEGTVQMAASGDVRWSMLSYRYDGQNRWSSDSVQIGGLGSAMGTIGMYTSAEHERSDPIGPVWMWKVGPADVWPTSGAGAGARSGEGDPGWIGGDTTTVTVDGAAGSTAADASVGGIGGGAVAAGPGPAVQLPRFGRQGNDRDGGGGGGGGGSGGAARRAHD